MSGWYAFRTEGWVEVEGVPVHLSDLIPGVEFFAYEYPDEGWFVLEARTGRSISTHKDGAVGHQTLEEAVERAKELLSLFFVRVLDEKIKNQTADPKALSPRYRKRRLRKAVTA